MPIISANEASRDFKVILNKVHYQGEHFEIKRGKDIIAQIIPAVRNTKAMKVSALKEFFQKLPSIEPEDKTRFEKDLEHIRSQKKFDIF